MPSPITMTLPMSVTACSFLSCCPNWGLTSWPLLHRLLTGWGKSYWQKSLPMAIPCSVLDPHFNHTPGGPPSLGSFLGRHKEKNATAAVRLTSHPLYLSLNPIPLCLLQILHESWAPKILKIHWDMIGQCYSSWTAPVLWGMQCWGPLSQPPVGQRG